MAVNTYDVSPRMVTARLPVDSDSIATGTRPLSTEDVTRFIEQGAAQITPILVNSGRSDNLSDEDMEAQVQAATIDYAVWKSLEALPAIPQPKIDAAERVWLEHLIRYSNRKEMLKTQPGDKTESNVSTAADKPASDFGGLNFKF